MAEVNDTIQDDNDVYLLDEEDAKSGTVITLDDDEKAEDEDADDKADDGKADGEDEKPEPEVKNEVDAPAPAAVVAPATPTTPAKVAEVDHLEAAGIAKDNTLGRKLVDALKSGGIEEVQKFLKVWGTDWSKVSDLDVVKQSLEQKYASLDPRKRDLLVKRDMAKYDLSTFDDDAKELAEAELELEAKVIRDGYKAEQSNYSIPDRSQPSPEEAQRQQQQQQELAAFEQKILTDPYFAEFETNKKVTLGEGDAAFNYATPDIDLKAALSVPFDEHFITRDKEGKPTGIKLREYVEALTFIKHRDKFLKEIGKHFKALGIKEQDAKLRNLGRGKEAAAPTGDDNGFQYLGPA